MNILIVEDDPQNARMIQNLITKWGHNVDMADTCAETLIKSEVKLYDLVILDIFLPDGEGYELIPRLKVLWPDIRIVAMTGFNTLELEKKIRRLGIIYYMTKPIIVNDLKSIVEHIDHRIQKTA